MPGKSCKDQVSNVQKNPYDIPWNPAWFIGILMMAYYDHWAVFSIPYRKTTRGILGSLLAPGGAETVYGAEVYGVRFGVCGSKPLPMTGSDLEWPSPRFRSAHLSSLNKEDIAVELGWFVNSQKMWPFVFAMVKRWPLKTVAGDLQLENEHLSSFLCLFKVFF